MNAPSRTTSSGPGPGPGPDVSIIIVSWNAKDYLRGCLESIRRTVRESSHEILVVDNDSADGSPAMVERDFPEVRLIRTGANLGFAKANNIGLGQSRGRHAALINSDVVLLDGCLDGLRSYLDAHPAVGLVGPQVLNADRTIQRSCYGFPTPVNALLHALGLNGPLRRFKGAPSLYDKYWPYDRTRAVDVLSGCFWLARREAIDRVGPLDEGFVFYWEDFDWCERLKQAGWEAVYHVDCRAIHFGGGSSVNAPDLVAAQSVKSNVRYWQKRHGAPGRAYILALMFLRHALRAARYTAAGLLGGADRDAAAKARKSRFVMSWILRGAHGGDGA